MTIRLIAKTVPVDANIDGAEGLMAFTARVSSTNQDNPDYARLLLYCLKEGHVSVFEQADFTYEIETTRDIAAQILRHKSMVFQEFSTRYQHANTDIPIADTRLQDTKNRQNSLECNDTAKQLAWEQIQKETYEACIVAYEAALSMGIAKELARKVLPLQTPTRMYMKGNVRSWIHYCAVRCSESTQKEHRDIARDIWVDLRKHIPIVTTAAESLYPQLGFNHA